MRSYRGPNTANLQTDAGSADRVPRPRTAGLAERRPRRTRARSGRSIAADMPLGLNIGDGSTAEGLPRWEAIANGEPGSPKGRELEFVELLSFLKRQRVRNVVWLTADVHYCAAHYYNPANAAFRDFDPLLGVRRRTAQRRHLRSEHARRHLRTAGSSSSKHRRPDSRTCRPQRVAVLRRSEHRRADAEHDGRPARHQRPIGLQQNTGGTILLIACAHIGSHIGRARADGARAQGGFGCRLRRDTPLLWQRC